MDKIQAIIEEALKDSNEAISQWGNMGIPKTYSEKEKEEMGLAFIEDLAFMSFYHNKLEEYEKLVAGSIEYENFEDVLAYTHDQAKQMGFLLGLEEMQKIIFNKLELYTKPKGNYTN